MIGVILALFLATGPSSEPYLSGDTWRHHVDHLLSDVEQFDPESVHQGDLIFVEQDSLNDFYNLYIPQIQFPYILITANCERGGDDPMPGKYEKILEDPHLVMWFTQNIDRRNHPKLRPIPIGLANRKFPWGDIDVYDSLISHGLQGNHNKWIYCNFNTSTNPNVRLPCRKHFQQHYREFIGMLFFVKPKPFQAYLSELSEYIFVICPHGGGLDTHRVWESLLMGCYPIVLSSPLDPLYENLPVVILDGWDNLSPTLLHNKQKEFSTRSWMREKLYFKYWFEQVLLIQSQLRNFI